MSVPDNFLKLEGQWTGTNRLHASWMPDPIIESAGLAVVTPRIDGQFLEIAYTWVFEEKQREGVVLVGTSKTTDDATAAWTDSWHMAHQLMHCAGKIDESGVISVFGTYKVEGHPDWGWRTELIADGDSLKYNMYNVSPDGVEEIAVEMDLKRS